MTVLGVFGTAAASSAPAGAPVGATAADTADKDAPVAAVVVTPSDSASVQLACGNTFVPPAPQGAAMYHYYKNCNGYTITVTTGYQNVSGQITVFGGVNVLTVPNQGEVSWYYPATQTNVNYSTIIVR